MEDIVWVKKLVTLIFFVFVNIAIVYIAVDGIPRQQADIFYGQGLLQNIDILS